MKFKLFFQSLSLAVLTYLLAGEVALAETSFPVPDTQQAKCFDDTKEIICPAIGEAYYGQDAQYDGTQPSYTDRGDGTITDNVTGLMWMKSLDLNGDGKIDIADKLSYDRAIEQAADFEFAGYDDWRLPTIKEMYSLMDFRGVDATGDRSTDTSDLTPFIDRDYFDFAYGDTDAGERIIDSQMASSTLYVSGTNQTKDRTMFGVNFADGRIKGYGTMLRGQDKLFYIMYVRGDTGYGVNDFTDNGDGIITDASTGLMWSQADSGDAMNWADALAWVQQKNSENYLGHNDWRLPNVKELQNIVDYTRSPDTSNSAAIDPVFQVTEIVNEAGQPDYPAYWTGV